MGMFVDGHWTPRWYGHTKDGHFVREDTRFRSWIRADGSSDHPAEAGRYHLYVSLACPWAHRVLIMRALKGLEGVLPLSCVNAFMGDDGWTFDEGPGVVPDAVHSARLLRDVYLKGRPYYTGRVTVPVLWDKVAGTIVNNESREIIRMLDRELDHLATVHIDLCPEDLVEEIDATIDALYQPINNGVYRTGFAGSQQAYDEAVGQLFEALDRWEAVLDGQRYLCGDRLTEADLCLFTTLIRFDLVYHTHFKCNVRRIVDYPNLWGHTKEIYQLPGVAETCDFDHVRRHYYTSHESLNPKRIVARGPSLDLSSPHGRDRLPAA